MKKSVLFLFLFVSVTLTLFAQEKKVAFTAQQLLKKTIDVSSPQTMVSISKQIVYFYTGRKRKFEVKNWVTGRNAKMLFEYLKPARVRGDKFLFLKGGDIWAYFSRTGRIRRIASSAKKAKMQGSDFSYEDVSMLSSLEEDYSAKIIGEDKFDGKKCYVLELKPKKRGISYNKLVAWVDKKTFVLRKMEFYKKEKLTKFLVQKDYKKIKGYYIPFSTVMESAGKNTKTEMRLSSVKVDVPIPSKMFRRNALAK